MTRSSALSKCWSFSSWSRAADACANTRHAARPSFFPRAGRKATAQFQRQGLDPSCRRAVSISCDNSRKESAVRSLSLTVQKKLSGPRNFDASASARFEVCGSAGFGLPVDFKSQNRAHQQQQQLEELRLNLDLVVVAVV